ncbi:hypothetical protein NX801_23550 [Streptomyces sp. LP05-1]|uniref:Uncharacterized protein n=1 Tax=Streptomyces pyxinae TaxID=2970734 RepID=A0ABT2CMC3_9ACTN|nr:hypothetical protein [Streptomyces sp. LP05-1]MCS0638579.1 hypothetical protein [Streptomyces sp. LP05-1]
MPASAQLLMSALSKQVPGVPGIPAPAPAPSPVSARYVSSAPATPGAGEPAGEPSLADLLPAPVTGEPAFTDTAPLTSEPPLADAAPLTSEPALTHFTPLTSEPTAHGTAGGPESPGA